MIFLDIIQKLYHNDLISRVFHTSVYCLQRELESCDSVLDLGCGPDSPIQYCDIDYSIGVEAYGPYIKESSQKGIHDDYVKADITDLTFSEDQFESVILIEVLEHLNKKEGLNLLTEVEKWAEKKVIISTPNGFLPQKGKDGNPLQKHRSGYKLKEMRRKGYKAYGMAGLRYLREENTSKNMEKDSSLYSSIRYNPKPIFLVISELTQLVTYYKPKYGFENFYVKEV